MSEKFVRKFMDGQISPQEYHAKHAFPPGAKCHACKRKPITTIRVYAPLKDILAVDPMLKALSEIDPQAFMQLVTQGLFKEPMLLLSCVYACTSCTPEAERAAAKGPSWVVVDIDRGPSPDRLVVQKR